MIGVMEDDILYPEIQPDNKNRLSLDEVIENLQNFKRDVGGNIFLNKCNIDLVGYDEKGIKHSIKSRTKKVKEGHI